MKSKPDGVSVTLMQEYAKRAGLEYVSKSHMFDLKKAFAARVRPLKRGDEARIVNWALAEERKACKAQPLPKAENHNAKSAAVAPLLAAAVAVLRNMGIQSISFFR